MNKLVVNHRECVGNPLYLHTTAGMRLELRNLATLSNVSSVMHDGTSK